MPYADPEKRKAAKRESFARRRAADPEFRKSEAKRVAKWYAENTERKILYVQRYRALAKQSAAASTPDAGS